MYLVTAQLTLFMATPMVYATPLWPAAGVALLGLLVCGNRSWSAVWLAAFMSDWLNRVLIHGQANTPTLWMISVTIASGAALQAVIGARVLRPVVSHTELLVRERTVFFLLALGGPLTCFISATAGVGSLALLQSLPAKVWLSTWVTWWAGDSLGVLIAMALLQPLWPAIRRQWQSHLLQVIFPTLATCALVLAGYVWLEHAERATREAQLSGASEEVRDHLTARLHQQRQLALNMSDLFNANENVSRAQFERFSQRSLEASDGLHALAWVPRITGADRFKQEVDARKDGLNDFVIWQRDLKGSRQVASQRAEYFPFWFISRIDGATSALGLDLVTEAESAAAMRKAADSATVVLAERKTFYDPQVMNRPDDWRLFVPIYRQGFNPKTSPAEARRSALRGFVVGSYYLDEIFGSVYEQAVRGGIAYRLSPLDAPNTSSPLFDNRPEALHNLPANRSIVIRGVDDNYLLLEIWSLTQWQPGKSLPAMLYLTGSVLVILLVLTFTIVSAGQNVLGARRVREGREQLRANEALLQRVIEASQFGYWDWDLCSNITVYSDRRFTMLGYEPGELSGQYDEWLAMLHPDDRARIDQQLTDYLHGKSESYIAEYRMRTKSGEWLWICDRGSISVRDDNGMPIRMSGVYADIHARKLAELAVRDSQSQLQEMNAHLETLVAQRTEALSESRRFMCAVLDSLSAHIAVINADGSVLATNRAWQVFAEQNGASALRVSEGANYLTVCDQAGLEGAAVAALIREVISGTRTEASFEYPCHSKLQPRWFQCWITRFPGDGPVRVVLAHENITQRKQAEQATYLLASELEATLQALPDLLMELDENGICHHVWSGEKTLLNAAQDKLLGHSVCEVLPSDAAQEVIASLQEAKATGRSQGHEIYLPQSQTRQWLELSVAMKESTLTGIPKRFVLLSRDITARKEAEEALHRLNDELEEKVVLRTAALEEANYILAESEEKLRSVIEHLADCVITTDERGMILSANPALEQIFGYSSDEVIGQNLTILMPKSMSDEHRRYMENYLRTGQAKIIGIGRQVEGRHKDGKSLTLELAISEYLVQGKRYFTGILRDISEQLGIMAEAELARREAEQANQAKSAFLATMSHEIRTPMNGVLGMIEVLQQTNLKGYQQEMVELIRDSAHSLLGIIEDILDFSKIEAGKLELEIVRVSVASVVEDVCALLDQVADKSGVELTLFTDPELPTHVLGDPLRLRQILINLVNNAIKFSKNMERPGKVSVRAELVKQHPDLVWVNLRVIDNGIGMDKRAQARLFQAFTQADASTTRRFGGSGLGLAICHQLVLLMQGQVDVDSDLDKGSTFTVQIPFTTVSGYDNREQAGVSLADLHCRVIGKPDGVAVDLSTYLRAAGACVDLESAPITEENSRDDRLWLWIIDAGTEVLEAEQLRTQNCAYPGRNIRFVIIERGRRRRPRAEAVDVVRVDANALNRSTFVKAVALAAGRLGEEVSTAVPAPPQSVPRLPSREEARRHDRLILVAEDNETNQKVILHQLALLGFAADVSSNGRMALERWQSGDYALLLTDLHMPEMDGYQLTAAIRRLEQGSERIPIIALTANTRKGEAQRCQEHGMNDYLSKPTQLNDLHAMLLKWLAPAPETIGRTTTPTTRLSSDALQPVDISVLATLVGDDPAVIEEFLQEFHGSAEKALAEMKSAHDVNDIAKVGAVAHRLKSSSRAVGALALGELCAELEEVVRADESKAVTTLVSCIEAEVGNVVAYLESR